MSDGYYRQPTLQKNTVVFVSDDDLWTVPARGGMARRLTSSLAEVSHPLLSRDGKLLAYAARDEGGREVYYMPAQGGQATRLTHGDHHALPVAWARDGRLFFSSTRGQPFARQHWLHSMQPSRPAEVERLPFGPARALAHGPQRGTLIGRNVGDPSRWKRYRGGQAGQLWIDSTDAGDWRPLISLPGNLASPMWLSDGRIYFVSDHEGVGNVYSCNPRGQSLRCHTRHQDYYVRNASCDGERIVYDCGAELYLLAPGLSARRIDVVFNSPRAQRNRKQLTASGAMEDWDLSAHGDQVVLSARGKLFVMPSFEGPVTQLREPDDSAGSARYRMPILNERADAIAAISDFGGEEHLHIFTRDPRASDVAKLGHALREHNTRYAALDLGRVTGLLDNPQHEMLAFTNHRYQLGVVDFRVEDKPEVIWVDRAITRGIEGFDWSPDGKWLAYGCSLNASITALKLWNLDTRSATQITDPVLRDNAPSFDPAGRFLFFISARRFEPVVDAARFEFGFPATSVPCLIALGAQVASPFTTAPSEPVVAEVGKWLRNEAAEPVAEPAAAGSASESSSSPAHSDDTADAKTDAEDKPPPKVEIELDGICNRVIEFPVSTGTYGQIMATKDGRKVYYTYRYPIASDDDDDGTSTAWQLEVYDIDERKEETIMRGVTAFTMSRDRSTLGVQLGRHVRVFKAGEKPDDAGTTPRKRGWIDLERVKIMVDPVAEWRQMFREAWRLQRDNFWTADMGGVDWLGIHDRYAKLLNRLSTRNELTDLLYEMQGELGTSHAYVYGGDVRWPPVFGSGSLGMDSVWDVNQAAWRVTNVLSGAPGERSPLAEPGVNVRAGDWLLAINGERLTLENTPELAMIGRGNVEVSLHVRNQPKLDVPDAAAPIVADAKGTTAGVPDPVPGVHAPRIVTVRSLGSERPVRYRSWVEGNRARVHAALKGQCGYLHVPDMLTDGYAEFFRNFMRESERGALVIDNRYNNGGNVSQLLLQRLATRRLGYDITRWGGVPLPWPNNAVLGPMVMLINEFSSSDGDIFPHGFRMLKLGKLIGVRTWGGVIGITPRGLADGGAVTQPEYSTWFNDVHWKVENYGVAPDITVDILPNDWAVAADPQLARAISEIKRQLKRVPLEMPKFDKRPNLAPPKLRATGATS